MAEIPGGGSSPVGTAGMLGPSPVANATTVSPRRAGFCAVTNDPSGRTMTAWKVLFGSRFSNTPGLACFTGTLIEADPPLTLTATGTLAAAWSSQGTWTVTDCGPAGLAPMLEIGAAMLLNVTCVPPSEVGSGPIGLPISMFWMPGEMPDATIVAKLHGEMLPCCRSAPFRNPDTVSDGPGGMTVRLKLAGVLTPATEAVTVTLPGVEPAVTFTCATPLLLVFTVVAESVAGPLTLNCTGTFAAVPFEAETCTTSGLVKAALTIAIWPLPETALMPVIVMFGIAVTVIVPFALEARVTVFVVLPLVSVVELVLARLAEPAGATDQFTVCPARPVPALESTCTWTWVLCPA